MKKNKLDFVFFRILHTKFPLYSANSSCFLKPKGGGGSNHQPSPMSNLFQFVCLFVVCFRVGVKAESGGGMMENIAETKKVVHVGVILDVNSSVGSVANACIRMAISDFYDARPNFRTRLSLHHRNSDDALAAAFKGSLLFD